jgi:hypothetical protein
MATTNQIASPENVPERIGVTIDGNHVAVLDRCPADVMNLIEAPLTCGQISHQPGGPKGYEEGIVCCDFYRHRRDGRLIFPAGLLPRVMEFLDLLACQVQITDERRDSDFLIHSVAEFQRLSVRGRRRLKPLLSARLGQVEVGGNDDAIDMAVHLAQIYPRARIDIWVATRKAAVKCHRKLQRELSEKVGLHVSGAVSQGRVAVGTPTLMPRDDPRDILILLTGEQLTGTAVLERLWRCGCRHQRRYAFVAANRRKDSWRDFALTAMTGPVISTCRRPRKQVMVAFASSPTQRPGNTKTSPGKKRSHYWRNIARNKLVAEVAEQFVSYPRQMLQAMPEKGLKLRQIASRKQLRVAVLAESAEHARELAKLLPTWRLQTANDAARRNLPQNADSPHSIVTETYAAKNGVDAQIVVRATGTSSPLRIKNFPPSKKEKETATHVLVVDLMDQFTADAEKCTQRRFDHYVELGWKIAIAEEVSEFQAARTQIPVSPGGACIERA